MEDKNQQYKGVIENKENRRDYKQAAKKNYRERLEKSKKPGSFLFGFVGVLFVVVLHWTNIHLLPPDYNALLISAKHWEYLKYINKHYIAIRLGQSFCSHTA